VLLLNWKRIAVYAIVIVGILFFPLMKGKQVQSTPVATNDKQSEEKLKEESKNQTVENPVGREEPEDEKEIFPKTMTVIATDETVPVNVRQQPAADSAILGIVYGNLMHVDVIEELDNGYTKISTWDYKSNEPIEGFVPKKYIKEIELDEKYGVVVNRSEQKVYIYEDDVLLKIFVCSTGLDENNYFTPKGIYRTGARGERFYNPRIKEGGYNWVRLNYNYLIHSVPFDENEKLMAEEIAKLGTKASHGCVRISMEDSKWFFDNIPQGTPVVIKD